MTNDMCALSHNRTTSPIQISSCTQSENETVIDPQRVQPIQASEIEKTVRDFSRHIALYTVLGLCLGTMKDSDSLRNELKHIRKRAYELARVSKNQLVPRMKSPPPENDIQKEFERIFFIFCSCLESFCEQLLRTSDLITDFSAAICASPERPNTMSLISTGLIDPYPCANYLKSIGFGPSLCGSSRESKQNSNLNVRQTRQVNSENGTGTCTGGAGAQSTSQLNQRQALEWEDLECLHREIQSIKDMILDIHSSIGINPWTVQPEFDMSRYERTRSLNSLNSDDVSELSCKHDIDQDNSAAATVVRQRRRRCLCLLVVVVTSVSLFAVVLGVCIKLLA